MKRSSILITALVVVMPVAFGAWHLVRASQPHSATDAAAPAPTASVRTAPLAPTVLTRRITTFGEVGTGQVLGVSFARAGQITRLVTAGRKVSKGAVLATLAADPAGQQAYQQAVSASDVAHRERQRMQELLKLQLATQSQVDAAEKAYRDAAGNVKALNQTGGGAVESVVTAPFDGVVLSVAGALGDRVAAGAPVLQFGHTDVLKVLIGIDPAARRLVTVGTPVQVAPLVGGDGPGATIAATVGELQDAVDPKSMLVTAVVYLRGPLVDGLVPGMKVRASLDIGKVEGTAVPRNAVLIDENGPYVFQVANGKARRTAVETGVESEGLVAISGLQDPKLPVVVVGNHELEDGMAVEEQGR